MRWRYVWILGAMAVLALAMLAGLGFIFLRLLAGPTDSTLARINAPSVSNVTCQGNGVAIRSGPRVSISSEWIVDADVVTMIQTYQSRGWGGLAYMGSTDSVAQMKPFDTIEYDLLIVQAKIYRSISLGYTPDFKTRLVSVTSAVFCPS
jgi:hypothetical protein